MTAQERNPYLNHFSGSAQEKAKRFASAKTSLLTPLLRILTALHVTPDLLSYLSLAAMAGFVTFLPQHLPTAMFFVLLHIALDGIDGSLARFQKKDSNAGAILDSFVDHASFSIALLALIYFHMADPFWAALYLLTYNVLIILVVVLNGMRTPLRFFVPTKYLFFAILLADYYVLGDLMTPFLMLASLLAMIGIASAMKKLQWSI